jgi:hypothetical protein
VSRDLQENPLVRIHVRGGVVQDVECPDGVSYEVIDYDNGADEPCEDCGKPCGKNAQYHEHSFWTCGCVERNHDHEPRKVNTVHLEHYGVSDSEQIVRRKIKVVAACTNAGGEPDFAFGTVECGEDEYNLGKHYDAVKDVLVENGYEGPFVMFDEDECPSWLLERFVWQSATCVSI